MTLLDRMTPNALLAYRDEILAERAIRRSSSNTDALISVNRRLCAFPPALVLAHDLMKFCAEHEITIASYGNDSTFQIYANDAPQTWLATFHKITKDGTE